MKELSIFKATSGLGSNSHIKSFTPSLQTSSAELKELGLAKKTIVESFGVLLGILTDPTNLKPSCLLSENSITLTLPNARSATHEYDRIFAINNGGLHTLANYFLNEKGSLFEYFWKGFNTSLIMVGERAGIFEREDGIIPRLIEKLFDYLSFYDAFSYLVGISAFCIHKPPKQPEKFVDTLAKFCGEEARKDIANIEVKTKEEARRVIEEVYKEVDRLGDGGNMFIRFMVYNVKSQTVSNLHLVDTLCHPRLEAQSKYKTISEEARIQYAAECYGQLKGMINELHRQSEMYRSQPPKVVFKQNSKFSQFVAPLLAGNSKTWLMGNILGTTSSEALCAMLDTLTKARSVVVPVVKVADVAKHDLGLCRIKKEEVKESKDSVGYMQVFGSAKKLKDISPSQTPSTIKKKLLKSRETPKDAQSEKKVRFKEDTQVDKSQSVSQSKTFSHSQQDQSLSQTYEWLQEYEKRKEKILGSVATEIKSASEYVTGLRTAFKDYATAPTPGFHAEPPKDESKSRVDKMKEIKGEIRTLLSKLENTSRSIGSSFKLEITPPQKEPEEVVVPPKEKSQEIVEPHQITREEGKSFLQQKMAKLDPVTVPTSPPKPVMETIGEAETSKSEVYLLRRKLEEMTRIAEHKGSENHRLTEEIERLKSEQREANTRKEIDFQSLKLLNKDLKDKIRALEEQSTAADIIEIYNKDIERLSKRADDLWNELISVRVGSIEPQETTDIKEAAFKKTLNGLKKLVKKMERSVKETEKENEELRKERRKWRLHEKLLTDATKKANALKIEKDKAETLIKELEAKLAELQESYYIKSSEFYDLCKRTTELDEENASLAAELKVLKDFAYNVDPAGLQIHYERYVKRQPQNVRREIWEDLLERLMQEVEGKARTLCENIQFEGREILKELDRLRDNQKGLIEILTKVHNDISEGRPVSEEEYKEINRTLRRIIMSEAA